MVSHEGSLGPRPSDVLGRYQLLMPIAKGGMGQVWVARLTGTRGFQKLVAVKTILPSNEDAANLESMLFDEASLASQIHHPNVAETLDLGEQEGLLYLVMEWVYGEPLDQVVRAARRVGGVPLRVGVDLIAQACRGLHAAHGAVNSRGEALGIVHRDVSPQNLLVTYAGVVKLVDFGVAKATQQMARPTTTGEVKGKFAYMAPEQVHGQALDARADVFAMGIVLYWLTTGEHPFRADNAAATLRNIISASPPLPTRWVPDYPPALQAVVMKALALDRDHRHASAHEMMVALERALPLPPGERGDGETRAFMARLFSARSAERAAALEAAMHAADSGLSDASPRPRSNVAPSQSTMRAVSFTNEGEVVVEVGELGEQAGEPSPAAARSPRRRATLTVSVLTGMAMVGLAANHWRTRIAGGARSTHQAATVEIGQTAAPAAPVTALPSAAALASADAPLAPAVSASASASANHPPLTKRIIRPSRREAVDTPGTTADPHPSAEPPRDPLNRRK